MVGEPESPDGGGMNFGEWICEAVHAAGVRHSAFEDLAGLSRGILYRWRAGGPDGQGHLPRLEIFIQACEVLNRIRVEHAKKLLEAGLISEEDYGRRLEGLLFNRTLAEALAQIPDYRLALKRQGGS